MIIRFHNFEKHLAPPQAYIPAISKVTERLVRMESKQEDLMEKLSNLLHCDEPDKPVVASETHDKNQNRQNSLLKLIFSLLVSSSISPIKSRCLTARASGNSKSMSCIALCSYLCEHGEDTKKWHTKPTPALITQVGDLQKKINHQGNFSRYCRSWPWLAREEWYR